MPVQFLGQEYALGKEMAPQPVFLPGKPHGQSSLVGYSLWGHKESDTTEHAHREALGLTFWRVIVIIRWTINPLPWS